MTRDERRTMQRIAQEQMAPPANVEEWTAENKIRFIARVMLGAYDPQAMLDLFKPVSRSSTPQK